MSKKQQEFFHNKKAIVTGGAGFIGSHLCEELLKLGARVVCLDDFSAGKKSNVAFMESENFTVAAKDVGAKDDQMDELFSDTDIVFHNAASKKNICLDNPHRDMEVNAGGALNLLQYSVKHGVKKFLHASTGSVYGEPSVFPTTEEHPFRPVSYYGVSKLAGERYVDVFNRLHGLDTTILRYFHVYGPRQESNEFGGVVSIFLRNIVEGRNPVIFGHGNQVRTFTWVKDLVQANLLAAMNPVSSGKAYNVASEIRVSIKELAEGMLEILDTKRTLEVSYGEPLLGDIMNFDVASQAIQDDLGLTFNQEFWKTLRVAIGDSKTFLGQ